MSHDNTIQLLRTQLETAGWALKEGPRKDWAHVHHPKAQSPVAYVHLPTLHVDLRKTYEAYRPGLERIVGRVITTKRAYGL